MGTSPVVIENPVINSPFDEHRRHYRFSNQGITNIHLTEVAKQQGGYLD